MEPQGSEPADSFRASVQAFVADLVPSDWQGIGALDPIERDTFQEKTRAALAERGWVAPAWPREYGGAGLGPAELAVVIEELTAAGVPSGSDNDDFGITMLGNTMLRWSDPNLLRRFLPRIASGEYVFAQGFSEPGAGSDLASLSLRAERHGDQWVLNGQKLWSSGAHKANWAFVLARTNPDAPAHRGISMLLVPLDQPGIDIRPIRNLTGEADFNEIFFDDATTELGLVVGEVDRGWAVAMTLLGFERGATALRAPIRFRNELERLIELTRERGLHHDPDIRRRIAWCHIQVEQLRCHGLRTAATLIAGEEPGPAAAAFKLLWSEYHQQATELAMDVLGLDALTPTGRPSPNWHRPPRDPARDRIADRVQQLPVTVALRPAAPPLKPGRHRQQRPDGCPLRVRHVRRIPAHPIGTIGRVAVHVREAITRRGGRVEVNGLERVQQRQQGLREPLGMGSHPRATVRPCLHTRTVGRSPDQELRSIHTFQDRLRYGF